MRQQVITAHSLQAVRVTPKTVWLFMRLVDDQGRTGLGEASFGTDGADVMSVERALQGSLVGQSPGSGAAFMQQLPFDSLPRAAWSSAVMQAMCDLQAQAADLSVSELLGGDANAVIPCYANINRCTTERSPAGFSASAASACSAGFSAFKIAPFDEMTPAISAADLNQYLAPGLARIEAVRERVGPQARLMVDCHWRFNPATAERMIAALEPMNLHWIECPIAESPEAVLTLKKLRGLVNAQGVLLAGMENGMLTADFKPYLSAGAYDVMMPDVKYAGGPWEMQAIAKAFAQCGVQFSPHNPTGPVCHAASLHVCAAVPGSDLLETQFNETPLFGGLVDGSVPEIVGGVSTLPRQGGGLGIRLDEALALTLQCEEGS